MKKEISLAEAAQELQLSKTTISRALSGKGRIGKETQDRIARFLEEQNAVVKTRSGMEKSKNIAILFPMQSLQKPLSSRTVWTVFMPIAVRKGMIFSMYRKRMMIFQN